MRSPPELTSPDRIEAPCDVDRSASIKEGLDAIFGAQSVALIGVSADPHKINGIPLGLLKRNGFTGKIYPVNPKYEEIAGLTCYSEVAALPEAPDVALIMLSAPEVPGSLRACGRRGVKSAVILSSGFEETSDGHQLAADLAAAANEYGMAVIGPNCEGIWAVSQRVVLTFGSAAARDILHHAPIAIISQSGAIAGALSRQLQDSGYGCSYVVSVGNETCVDALDVFEWMIGRPDVKVIVLFIEGIRGGGRLRDLSKRARKLQIRVVALKSGNSAAGMAAAGSHTGKIASAYAIYRDILGHAGLIQVDGIADLIEAGQVLCSLPPPRVATGQAGGLSVFSIPGGTRALIADLCDRNDIPLAKFDRETVRKLTAVLPSFAQAENPTDMTGQILSRPELFEQALDLVAGDPNTEILIVQLANRGPSDLRARRQLLAAVAKQHSLPVVVSMLGDALPAAERSEFVRLGCYIARDPVDAVRACAWLYTAREALFRTDAAPPVQKTARAPSDVSWAAVSAFLQDLSIPVVESVIVQGDGDELGLSGLKPPFVVKALPEHCEHKTEKNLVQLGLSDHKAVYEAVRRIRRRLEIQAAPVLVQEMAIGIEAVISVVNDRDFGSVLVIGMGGKFIELWQDVAYIALPATVSDVEAALNRLKLASLLDGFRGSARADKLAFITAAVTLGNAVAALRGRISEIELNPVFVGSAGYGIKVADVLLRIETDARNTV